ncbi:hypothetical protein OBBRIDRAFT_506606 [Obba rivulosa]|uniref:DRBM domain-containing protein n=1 Tax=Obba rivulosa TaxID=1052685 RepID=A0A8E2B0R9_9APHY|nr:hypothetical protein OBBRIDRAFT_506606 [Obba rivulosa]
MSNAVALPDHWCMQLNNYLQERGERDTMTWEIYKTGPQHRLIWHAIVYVRSSQYGRHSARTRAAAKEGAARQAFFALLDT